MTEQLSLSHGTYQLALVVKNLPANVGDTRHACSIPGSGRSPGGGHGNPLHYSFLENPHGQRSLVGHVHGVTRSWTQPSDQAQHSTKGIELFALVAN